MATPKKDKLSASELAIEYNYAYALLMSDPELKALFNKALTDKTGQWTAQKFAAKLRTTDWYKKHNEAWRTSEALKLTDPAEYKKQIASSEAAVKAQAAAMGVTLSQSEITSLGWKLYRYGYSEERVRSTIATYIDPPEPGGSMVGEAGDVENELRMIAQRNGQKYADSFYFNAAKAVIAGTTDIQAFTDQVRKDAASSYPVFADKITAGMDVADLASGYVNRMAQTFELDPEQIGLDDPYIKQALGGMAQDGTPTAMGMWEFEKSLRADPKWAQTKQARDAADDTAMSVLRTFGFQ
jgi:hypothetical protein